MTSNLSSRLARVQKRVAAMSARDRAIVHARLSKDDLALLDPGSAAERAAEQALARDLDERMGLRAYCPNVRMQGATQVFSVRGEVESPTSSRPRGTPERQAPATKRPTRSATQPDVDTRSALEADLDRRMGLSSGGKRVVMRGNTQTFSAIGSEG